MALGVMATNTVEDSSVVREGFVGHFVVVKSARPWSVKQSKYLTRKNALTEIRTLHLRSKSHQRLLWMQRPIWHGGENLPAVSCLHADLGIGVVVQFGVLRISMQQD